MDDTGTTQVAPAPASDAPAPGSETPGSTSGSQPDADTFAAERSQLDLRVRQEQSRADRAEAELARLRAAQTPGDAPTTDGTAGLTLADIRAEMLRTQAIAEALPGLREQFKYADAAIFARAHEFDSAEALAAAAEDSHKSVEERIQPAVEARLTELREQYAARFGPLTEDIAPPGGESSSVIPGMPSAEELNRMSFSEYREFAEANPEYVKSLLRTA